MTKKTKTPAATTPVGIALQAWMVVAPQIDRLHKEVVAIDNDFGDAFAPVDEAARCSMSAAILTYRPETMSDLAVQLAAFSGEMERVLKIEKADAFDYFLSVVARMASYAADAAGVDAAGLHLPELMAYEADMRADDNPLYLPRPKQW